MLLDFFAGRLALAAAADTLVAMGHSPRLVAGAMSGTSADGVDVAVAEVTGTGLQMQAKVRAHHAREYPVALRKRIFGVRQSQAVGLRELAELGREISLQHAGAVRDALQGAGLNAADLTAVAVHGQTLFHAPPNTIQWIDPALIAAEVGCQVVSDFRRADCAAGGEGAPLVPFADYILFRDPQRYRFVINIGGIANYTLLPAGASPEQVLARDTGPGNCLSDFLMREAQPDGPGFDRGGELASRGTVVEPIIVDFFQNGYFQDYRKRAKSTDIPAMITAFQKAVARYPNASLPDRLATACAICVAAIGRATSFLGTEPLELIVSGGGVENRCLMEHLRKCFAGRRIIRTDELGIPSAAKEALAFALLGAATLDGVPSNIPSATGARRSVVLGSITPKPFETA